MTLVPCLYIGFMVHAQGERRRSKLLGGGDPPSLGHGSGGSRARAVLKAFSVVTNWEVLVRPTKHGERGPPPLHTFLTCPLIPAILAMIVS